MAETSKPTEVLKDWIFQSLYHSKEPLSDWEQKFLVSVDKQLHANGSLSERQQKTLEAIYAERT